MLLMPHSGHQPNADGTVPGEALLLLKELFATLLRTRLRFGCGLVVGW